MHEWIPERATRLVERLETEGFARAEIEGRVVYERRPFLLSRLSVVHLVVDVALVPGILDRGALAQHLREARRAAPRGSVLGTKVELYPIVFTDRAEYEALELVRDEGRVRRLVVPALLHGSGTACVPPMPSSHLHSGVARAAAIRRLEGWLEG